MHSTQSAAVSVLPIWWTPSFAQASGVRNFTNPIRMRSHIFGRRFLTQCRGLYMWAITLLRIFRHRYRSDGISCESDDRKVCTLVFPATVDYQSTSNCRIFGGCPNAWKMWVCWRPECWKTVLSHPYRVRRGTTQNDSQPNRQYLKQ